MSAHETVRVLIVDDHKIVRTGLRTMISLNDGLEVVGEAANGQSGIDQCSALGPNVVLMDMKMPGMDGPTAIERISAGSPEVKVLALTSFDDPRTVHRALEAGAVGYLLKDCGEDELVAAIRLAARGRGAVAVQATKGLVANPPQEHGDEYRASVTAREMDVLQLVAGGLTNSQISNRLSVSLSTVNFHVHNILDKLGAKTRTEALAIAVREGLVDLHAPSSGGVTNTEQAAREPGT
jgi:NarL family two-component system response regulator LiaR